MNLMFLAGVIKEDKLYFSSWVSNGLFMYDLSCNKCQCIDIFTSEDEELNLHNKAILFKNEIWFIPNRANQIAYYDIDKKKIAYLELPQEGREILDANYNKTFRFNCLHEDGSNCCWLVPVGYSMFLQVDFEEKEVRKVDGWSSLVKCKDGTVNFYTGFLQENTITFCSYDYKKELTYDIRLGKFMIKELSDFQLKCRNIVQYKDKKFYIFTDLRKNILVCDENNNVIKQIGFGNISETAKLYIVCTVRNQFLYLFPFSRNKIIKIDLDTQDIVAEIAIEDLEEGCFIQNVFNYKGVLYASSDRLGSVICLDENDQYRIVRNVISKSNYFNDLCKLYDLNDYSTYFKNKSNFFNNLKSVYENDGEDLQILINRCTRLSSTNVSNELGNINGSKIYKIGKE